MSFSTPRRIGAVTVAAALGLGALAVNAPAEADRDHSAAPMVFNHVGTAYLEQNVAAGVATSAEIIAFDETGDTLVYTDPFTRNLGVVDTSNPATPVLNGFVELTGDPTSVGIIGGYALAAVVTDDTYTAPEGELLVIDLTTREIVRTLDLGGQPDSVAIAPSGDYAAVAIENERDEDLNDGLIPQLPAGFLQIVDLDGGVDDWVLRPVQLTGLAETAPSDPEPEYVDINDNDMAVVSLQENNHLVVVNLADGSIETDFSAGTAVADDIDVTEEEAGPQESGVIILDGSANKRREPDTVNWIDDDTFATANEGDYEDAQGEEGGSRSFTLFNVDGTVEYESGSSFEHEIVRAGHYPEGRSENKGAEPEGIKVAEYRGQTYLFVGAERANVVGVYRMAGVTPQFLHVMPTGIGPEGFAFHDGVLAVSAEVDGLDEGFAARPFITLFEAQVGKTADYPFLVSANDEAGLPIPWVAQSGLAGDRKHPKAMWSVSDSFLAQSFLYKINVTRHPAVITDRIPVGGLTGVYDLEGVATRAGGGFWLASEGRTNTGSSRPNLLLEVGADGTVLDEITLPESLVAGATSSGFEGVAVTGSASNGDETVDETVYVVIQRGWADDAPGFVKIGKYEVGSGKWSFASYPLDAPESPAGGWVGLSEITAMPDGSLVIVERDNHLGLQARVKRLYSIDPSSVEFAPHGQTLPVLDKTLFRDLMPVLDAASIAVPDKVEGLGIAKDGRMYISTDNDGVDENYGESLLVELSRR